MKFQAQAFAHMAVPSPHGLENETKLGFRKSSTFRCSKISREPHDLNDLRELITIASVCVASCEGRMLA